MKVWADRFVNWFVQMEMRRGGVLVVLVWLVLHTQLPGGKPWMVTARASSGAGRAETAVAVART